MKLAAPFRFFKRTGGSHAIRQSITAGKFGLLYELTKSKCSAYNNQHKMFIIGIYTHFFEILKEEMFLGINIQDE